MDGQRYRLKGYIIVFLSRKNLRCIRETVCWKANDASRVRRPLIALGALKIDEKPTARPRGEPALSQSSPDEGLTGRISRSLNTGHSPVVHTPRRDYKLFATLL